jgi:predicted DNA-binding transcriptional regulator AlpA
MGAQLSSKTLVTRREGRRRAGNISRTSEHRLLKQDPSWPRPVEITPGLTGYYLDELEAWIESRPRTEAHRLPGGGP